MPNKKWDMGVDMIPETDGTYNLGDASKKWKVNGYDLGAACAKGVDTSISSGSSSTNVPTTSAVVNYVSETTVTVSVSGKTLVLTDIAPQSEEASP